MAKVSSVRNRSAVPQSTPEESVSRPVEPEPMSDVAGVEPASLTAWQKVWQFLGGPYPTLLSRLVLGGILLIAGLSKVGAAGDMMTSINSYQMPLPTFVVQIMAWSFPIIEVIAGLCILAGLYLRIAAATGGALMLIFTIAITQAWLRGIQADCGCAATTAASSQTFGSNMMRALGPVGGILSDDKIGPFPVVRDVIFIGLAVHLVLAPAIYTIDNWRRSRAEAELEFEEA